MMNILGDVYENYPNIVYVCVITILLTINIEMLVLWCSYTSKTQRYFNIINSVLITFV